MKNMKDTSKEPIMSIVNKTDKDESNSNTELIERYRVPNTPFDMITINSETFGTFGKFRITEIYQSKEECLKILEKVDWNRLVQIMTLVFELMNKEASNILRQNDLNNKLNSI